MKSAQFADLVTCLSGDQPPRVWSLLVTIFGELAQEDCTRISGVLLRHLSDLIGFKPEAVRVALHRLRKEGWIESQRQGRNSDYFLTDWGRAQSAAASPRIYNTGPMAERAWLVVLEPGCTAPRSGPEAAYLASNVLLTSQLSDDKTAFVTTVTESQFLPEWMTRKLCDENITAFAKKLIAALGRLEAQTEMLAQLDPCKQAVLRVLIVHDWRRIVLKTTVLPDYVFPEDWLGKCCRRRVIGILEQLPRQDVSILEQCVT